MRVLMNVDVDVVDYVFIIVELILGMMYYKDV